ncbi:MAG: hypothetical protein ACFE9L_18990 [Candidatus Hodarchaeota archaeon]
MISLKSSNNDSWSTIWRGSTDSSGKNIILDSNGSIIVHGQYGNGNIIVKYNNSGEQLWNQTYGQIWNFWEFRTGWDIASDSMNNIYLTGRVAGEHDWTGDGFLVKFNNSGVIQWEHEWGLGNEYSEDGRYLAIDSEDNIYVVGSVINSSIVYDIFLRKYYANGTLAYPSQIWEGFGWEWVTDIEIDDMNNMYIIGITNSTPDKYDMFLLKYNSSGTLQWNITWGGDQSDYFFKIAFDSLDRLTAWGYTESFGGKKTIILKIDDTGNLIGNETLIGEPYSDYALDSEDNVICANWGEFYAHESTDIYIALFNETGCFESDLIWGTNNTESLGEMVLDSFDNIYLVGSSNDDIFLAKNPEDKGEHFPPCLFTLTSNGTSIESNSDLYLNWTNSRGANNYSVFIDTSPITDLNGVVLVQGDLNETRYTLSNFSKGIYYYVVVAYNDNGYTLSNYISLIVNGDEIISFGLFSLIFFSLGIVYVVLSIIRKIRKVNTS